jgi:hypothetical protein
VADARHDAIQASANGRSPMLDPPITALDAASPSGLPGAAGRTIDLAGGEAGVRCGKLHIDQSKLCRVAGTSQRVWPPNFCSFSIDAPPETCKGVQMGPGATPFTRMPFGPSCFASDLM